MNKKKNMPFRISKEKEDYIIKNYHRESTKNILEKLKISKPTLLRYVKKSGLIVKTSKLYDCNENYFENINTEEKSYWLGFLYADGYVRDRKNNAEMRLKLSIKDIEHLGKLKKALNTDSEIKIKECQAILSINQKKFVKNLIDKGCVQAKTQVIKFPLFLREDLKRHFIRGYFDGDGSIKFTDKNSPSFNVVSGSFSFLESFKDEISNKCNIRNPKIYTSSNEQYGNIFWNSIPDIISIYFYLYKNSNIYLNRKREKFLKIIEYIKTKEKTNRKNAWKRTKYIMEMQ